MKKLMVIALSVALLIVFSVGMVFARGADPGVGGDPNVFGSPFNQETYLLPLNSPYVLGGPFGKLEYATDQGASFCFDFKGGNGLSTTEGFYALIAKLSANSYVVLGFSQEKVMPPNNPIWGGTTVVSVEGCCNQADLLTNLQKHPAQVEIQLIQTGALTEADLCQLKTGNPAAVLAGTTLISTVQGGDDAGPVQPDQPPMQPSGGR